jgi:isoleucyl-tRNA synthetase
LRNQEIEKEVDAAQMAVTLGHSLRKEYKIKVRQPLQKAHLISSNEELLQSLKKQKQLIADELNVKEIEFHADESQFVKWIVKPNFPVLGKKIGKLIPEAQKTLAMLRRNDIQTLAAGKPLSIQIGDTQISLDLTDVQIERKVKEGIAADNLGDLTVCLDLELNEILIEEGFAREIVNKINTMRKEMGLEVTDRVHITIQSTEKVKKSFLNHEKYINKETLSLETLFGPCEGELLDLNGEEAKICIKKA